MKSTHIYTDKFNSPRKLANRALKAMTDIQDYDNGTIKNPECLASTIMEDGRSLIQTIYEDGEVMYNDDYYIVEVDDYSMYVDVSAKYLREVGIETYGHVWDKGLGIQED